MKKIIELIPNTKVEINTDKNGKSVILYSDNREEEGVFNDGDIIMGNGGMRGVYTKNLNGGKLTHVNGLFICGGNACIKTVISNDNFKLASLSEMKEFKENLIKYGFYFDENEKCIKKNDRFKVGDYVIFKTSNQLHKGIIYDIYNGKHECCDVFIPLEPNTFYRIYMKGCFHPTAVDIEEIEFQMLKIGKKWDGEKIVDIIWKPKVGEEYYYINAEGETCGDKYDGNIKWIDEQRFYFGNCFKTGEEAVSYRNKIKELLTNRNK